MRKTALGILAATLLLTASCKKGTTNPSNYWSFKGTTYPVDYCSYYQGGLIAYNSPNDLQDQLTFIFNTLPTTGGIYTVVNGLPTNPNQVSFGETLGGSATTYASTGANGTETVSVEVLNGKISVTGSGIMMINTANSSDISALSVNVTQTQ